MIIDLERFAYLDECTRGVLHVGNHIIFQTIERPWVKNPDAAGGLPFESCIPDGTYRMRAWTRPSGKKAFILSNADHGVFEQQEDMGVTGGRYLILMHVGNTVVDVVGCIAPVLIGSDRAVGNSRKAMLKLHELLDGYEHELRVGPKKAA